MQEKVNDTIDAQKESQRSKEEEMEEQEIILRNSPIKNPNAPVAKDISHLVKKKKKAEESHELEPPAKKQCPESSQEPDSSTTNGTGTNGHNKATNVEDSLPQDAPTTTTQE
jgi:hypothetical protein